MLIWVLIVYTVSIVICLALVYLSHCVGRFDYIKQYAKGNIKKTKIVSSCLILTFFVLIWIVLNLANAGVCTIYIAMFFGLSDLISHFLKRFFYISIKYIYIGTFAIIGSITALSIGWYLDHHIWQTTYSLTTAKNISSLKVIVIADTHTGTTFDAKGFANHVAVMQKENPDIVIIAGDFVDDDTTKEDMIETSRILGEMQTKYGIYFIFGNHDKGYYGAEYRGFSEQELINELKKNGIRVLRDEAILVGNDFYIIGRRDFSEVKEQKRTRKTMSELVQPLDSSKYMIVVDHQPTDYINQEKSGVDLVLSGHTHGGQLFPFNQVGKWLGVNDLIYGYERRNKTDFIVTSGLSDWAIKFKTGTKSEFVVVNITKQGN